MIEERQAVEKTRVSTTSGLLQEVRRVIDATGETEEGVGAMHDRQGP